MKKIVSLVHNPTAGDEKHTKEALINGIEAAGFECRYSSTKEAAWKARTDEEDTDIIAVAGGDGTVRKVIRQLLKKKDAKPCPVIGVIALGTANNIAKSLKVYRSAEEVINSWQTAPVKKVDIGIIKNIPGVKFFFEGMGFGLFPYLIKKMQEAGEEYASPKDELKGALKRLHSVLQTYKPRQCTLTVDGTDHSGKFFMVEVMNIRSIGPNMVLAPLADPSDGEFDVVLVPEAHKEKISDAILEDLRTDTEGRYPFHTLKGKDIRIQWDGIRIHADDQMLMLPKEAPIEIALKPGVLQFFTGQEESNEQ